MENDLQHTYHFLKTLVLVLGAAGVSIVLCQKLKQPVILGYLIAGMIIGPHTRIPLFADSDIVHTLSELGVILLMFALGLEFSIRQLVKVFPSAGLIAILQCSIMIWIGYLTGQLSGWTKLESVYAGAIIAISSTTIIIKAFSEQKIQGKLTEIVFGILIVEDLVAILLLAILTPLSQGIPLSGGQLFHIIAILCAFLVGLLAIGLLIIPRLIRWIVRFNRPETTLVASIGFCFAVSLLAQKFGYSVALGAFLAGSLVAESGEAKQIEHLVQPVRDLFGAIFFVSVGMMINPTLIPQYGGIILIFTLLVIVGKIVGVALGSFLTGYNLNLSIKSGMSLAQIGEFSFIIASVGLTSGATRDFLYPIAVTVSALTTLTTPWLIRASTPVAEWIHRHLPQSIRTFASFYESWIQKLKQTSHASRKPFQRIVRWLILDFAFLTLVVIASALLRQPILGFLSSKLPFSMTLIRLLYIIATLGATLPFGIGIIRLTKRLGFLLATQAIPTSSQEELDLGATPRKILIVTLEIIVILILGIALLAITQPFLPIVYSSLLFGLGILFLGISFWRGAQNFQGHVKAGLEVLLEKLMPKTPLPVQPRSPSLEQLLPGIGNIVSLELKERSIGVGKTLSDLNLRGITEANVIAIIKKGGEEVTIPTGKEILQAGDLLALVGSPEAIEASRKLLGNIP